ncbi:MAG: AlkA N-terminal domain-containing protein [Gammaproteobacteria bacterium]
MPGQICDMDRSSLYQAIRSRDARFDGRIFVAVKSTKIYCRPICRAKCPKIEHCTFYPLAALAEKNGYRPCLLCRPELAPGESFATELTDPLTMLAKKAVRRIEDGALNALSVDALAAEFNVTGRHLRKAFETSLGVSPTDMAHTCRLLQAKQLLTETNISITEVAFSAGFSSLRQFNHVFRKKYRMAPRDFRKAVPAANGRRRPQANSADQTLRLDYRPPLNWALLSGFLKTRAIPGVELIDDDRYVRTVAVGKHRGWLSVKPSRDRHKSSLEVQIADDLVPVATHLLAKIRTVFDVRANIEEIEQHLSADPVLATVIKRCSGMRLPGAFDGFELLLRAILGQQISVKAATTLAGRFAKTFGQEIDTPFESLQFATPAAEAIADAKLSVIRAQGLPQKRAETIKAAATAAAEKRLVLEPGSDPALARNALVEIPGIGEWTADYVAMRALDWPDAFPSGDLGVKKALGLSKRKDVIARSQMWQPWRAYATMHLWLSLAD